MTQQVNLVFVDETNHNKFYNMTDLGNGNFKAEWGRVGSSGQSMEYPIAMWDSKLDSKLKKGYAEIKKSAAPVKKTADIKIADLEVKSLIKFLIKSAKTTIETSYQVSADEVSPGQIAEAQKLIDGASRLLKSGRHTKDSLNSIFRELYQAIPRKMSDTRKYFLRDDYQESFVTELLQSEQNLLDTLESQTKPARAKITLDSLGFEIETAGKADRDLIAAKTDFKVANQRIFKVTNKATEAAFKKGGKTKLLYHGTRNCNWMAVLQKGLKIRPNGVQTTGSMFGDAIYFANKAGKSLGYTSLRGSYWASGKDSVGYLAVFAVNTGKEWNLLKNQRHQSWMTRIDADRVKREGCDTVYAKGGADLRNDEYVVYDSRRCTIRYLIEVKN
jgi:poly [ADP-ribose] polymerase